jgi:hypothetical protein
VVGVAANSDQSSKQIKDQKLAVTVGLDDAATAKKVDTGPVGLQFDGERRKGVLTVAVEALLALREGGYAVEVVSGAGSRLVAVQLGLFADGRVEVTGDGLAEGVRVVTAA